MDLSLATPLNALDIGDAAPWFVTRSGDIEHFHLASLGGRNVVLCFPGVWAAEAHAATGLLARWATGVSEMHAVAFAVVAPEAVAGMTASHPALRLFHDTPAGDIARSYGIGPEGGWVVLDPLLRVLICAPLSEGAALLAQVQALPADGLMGPRDNPAPVLVVPRVFEPEFCRRLIALYQADGGQDSGYMRERDGKTVGVIDHSFKRRRDLLITDKDVMAIARMRIEKRLLPMIARALQFRVTRMERYIVACYDSADRGFFRPHRDNTTRGTAHRRFAVTINLNADEFEGGELCFPEFGRRTYRAPTGGAVVFSCSLLHEAQPVTKGVRYAFLPFLYDEEGARVREQNVRFLADPVNGGYGVSSQRTS